MVAGCLLLGAGFLIKLDATGPRGNILDCSYGVLAAVERTGSGADNGLISIPLSEV